MVDSVEALKREAAESLSATHKASWRENDERLIWCGLQDGGSFVFRNTTHPTKAGPVISEREAARYLAEEGPWIAPRSLTSTQVGE